MQHSLFQPDHEAARWNAENDDIQFAEETDVSPPAESWKILIVDDEAEVHEITCLALSDVTFEGRSLTFISAYSAAEALQIVQANPDIAVIFLDVVMETDDAGLQLITSIREDLGNLTTRIILRTGQPGQAPEEIVAVNYGIDDYKTKTELTARKLFISVITALRTFSTIMQMMASSPEPDASPQAPVEPSQEQRELLQLEQKLASLQSRTASSDPQRSAAAMTDSAAGVTGAFKMMSIVTRISRMVLRIMDGTSSQLGLSQSKLGVLMYLSGESDLCARPSVLASHCGVSRAAMTGLLDSLEAEGYVERDQHPGDRRALMVKLLPPGQAFLERITLQDYQVSELMKALDVTERRTLIELIMKFVRLLDAQPELIDP